jgi:flagellar biosynthesis GTPase FlhF
MTDHVSSHPHNISPESLYDGIISRQEISPEFRMQISDISQSIQELYLDAQAQVNQMRKFQKALEEVLGDEVQAELGLSDLLIEWKAILRDRKVQTTEQKVQTTEQKVQTTEQKVQQDATTKATEQTTKATEQTTKATEQTTKATTEQKVQQDATTKATEQTTHSIKAQETKESVSQRESHLRTLTADLTNQLSSLTG